MRSWSERNRGVHLADDIKSKLVGIDVERNPGKMIAHEERIVRCNGAFIENRERSLKLGRPLGKLYERPLLRKRLEYASAVRERQRHRLCESPARAKLGTRQSKRQSPGHLEEIASVEHGGLGVFLVSEYDCPNRRKGARRLPRTRHRHPTKNSDRFNRLTFSQTRSSFDPSVISDIVP